MKSKYLFTIGFFAGLTQMGIAQESNLDANKDGIISMDLAGCYTFMDNNFCESQAKVNTVVVADDASKKSKKKAKKRTSNSKEVAPAPAASAPVMDRSGCLIEHLYFTYDEEWGLQVIIDWDKAKLEETKVDAMIIAAVVGEELITLNTMDLQLHEDLFMRGVYRSDVPFEEGVTLSKFMIQEQFYVLLNDKLLESEESCKTFVDRTMSEIYEQANSQE